LKELAYTIRESGRARRVALKVTPHGRVEVVVPRGISHALVPDFVAQHRGWIDRTLLRFEQASKLDAALNVPQPARIELPAIDECWSLSYTGDATRLSQSLQSRSLRLPAGNDEQVRSSLFRWLRGRAVATLELRLRALADRHGFHVNRVSFRSQRSRWGSCSSKANINLNTNLLFLQPEVVRYLFVHELCHTVHMNHSRAYWQLVAQVEPDWKTLDARLRDGFRYVPLWAYPE
jgi:predicted metal-dependent hydrolase